MSAVVLVVDRPAKQTKIKNPTKSFQKVKQQTLFLRNRSARWTQAGSGRGRGNKGRNVSLFRHNDVKISPILFSFFSASNNTSIDVRLLIETLKGKCASLPYAGNEGKREHGEGGRARGCVLF